MWLLYLNDMRSSNVENVNLVANAETEEEIKSFLERERVEHYVDGQWGKCFRKDGPLEWYNDLPMFGEIFERLTLEDALQRYTDNYNNDTDYIRNFSICL